MREAPLIPEEAVQAAAEALKAIDDAPDAHPTLADFQRHVAEVALEAAAPVLAAQVRREYEDLLGSIWLYIGWRYVTKQLTTEQKNLFADAVEADLRRGDGFEDGELDAAVDRWWRDDAPARQIGEDRG